MKIRKFYTAIVCVILCLISLSSCSNDEDGGNNPKGSVTINGNSYRAENCECKDGVLEEYADVGCYFETLLYGNEDSYRFSIKLYNIYDLDKLHSGDDITDIVTVSTFCYLTSADASRFEDNGGKIVVKSVNNNTICLEFNNFKFNRRNNDTSYTVNGTIEYERFD